MPKAEPGDTAPAAGALPDTAMALREAMPRILGPRLVRRLGGPLDAVPIAGLAAVVKHARQSYAKDLADQPKHRAITSAAALLVAAGVEVPADLAALLARPRVKWAGHDHAALMLAREFQSALLHLPGEVRLGAGGATARFVAWAMMQITGAPTSPDSLERQAKRAAARYRAIRAGATKALQDKDLRGDKVRGAKVWAAALVRRIEHAL